MTDPQRAKGGSAVMQQRANPRADALDDFPTPPWATRALIAELERRGYPIDTTMTAREPSANRGYMFAPLSAYFRSVDAFDVADYRSGFPVKNYLTDAPLDPVNWTITNPPFVKAEEFVRRALMTSTDGVAILARTSFLEGAKRWAALFSDRPPALVLQFCERVVMQEGHLPNPNKAERVLDPKTGKMVNRKPSTATSYCWIVWTIEPEDRDTRLGWIEPCRRRLERQFDYPEN